MADVKGTPREVRKAAIASLFGSALEWYDFFLYGTAAALIFNSLFFPTFNPLVGTVENFRRCLLRNEAPDFTSLQISAVIAVIVLPLAYLFFKHREASMADII